MYIIYLYDYGFWQEKINAFCFTFDKNLHKNNYGDIIKSGINYMHWVCVRHKVPKLKHTKINGIKNKTKINKMKKLNCTCCW